MKGDSPSQTTTVPSSPAEVVVEVEASIEEWTVAGSSPSSLPAAGAAAELQLPALQRLSRILAPCAKIEWNQSPQCCTLSPPTFTVEGYGWDGIRIFDLEGPPQNSLWKLCSAPQAGMPFCYQDETEALRLNYCPTASGWNLCANEIHSVEVSVPGRHDPIGKIEYTAENFADNTVKLTNTVTGEVFTGSPTEAPRIELPRMEVRDSAGRVVAYGGVSASYTSRGSTTYRGMQILFADQRTAVGTKALMIAFMTAWKADHQRGTARGAVVGLAIAIFLTVLLVVILRLLE